MNSNSLTIISIVIISLLIITVFQNHETITGKRIILGDRNYDNKVINAPKSNGLLLKLVSDFLQTRFAPAVVRLLINDNGASNLRELACQITIPSLHYPLRRLNSREREMYQQEITEDGSIKNVLRVGYTEADHGEVKSQGHHVLRSVMDYARRYREGKDLPTQVLSRTIKQIRQWEKEGYRIFTEVQEEEVKNQAKQSDERFRSGKPLSILDGVPVAIKDTLAVKGYHVYNGLNPSAEYSSLWYLAEDDDVMVKRFREAGAIILGLTIMTEAGVTPLGYNTHFKGPFSAFSEYRYTGGSSSGSGVAVATGIVPIAVGFDQGGSIRFPGQFPSFS
jgi:hypothetical protein